jgi:hypothetical protein
LGGHLFDGHLAVLRDIVNDRTCLTNRVYEFGAACGTVGTLLKSNGSRHVADDRLKLVYAFVPSPDTQLQATTTTRLSLLTLPGVRTSDADDFRIIVADV